MKTSFRCSITLWLCLSASLHQAQSTANSGNAPSLPPSTPYLIMQQDANSQVWARTVYELGPSGQAVPREHRYTELATGLNFRDPTTGQWTPSKEEIDILPNGTAAATQGQHRAYFPGDIAQGVIELDTPDSLKLQSRPIGLSYDNGTNTVLFAVLTNSVGELLAPNQVIYPNAFEGAAASLRYTYTRAGFEQDILIQEQLPPPESFGLDSANTRLQVLTEFFDTSNPVQTPGPVNSQYGLGDTTLTFGAMTMEHGRAFTIGTSNARPRTPTYKSWLYLNGRTFLMEQVPYPRIAPQLEQLPTTGRANATNTNSTAASSILNKVSTRRLLPPVQFSKTEMGNRKAKITRPLAKAGLGQKRSVVLDYVTINSGQTHYTFQGGMTYYISGTVNISGNTFLEGGAVLKYPTNGSGCLVPDSQDLVTCQTGSYRPAIFTSMNDNSVGETISGSTGSPTTNSDTYISFQDNAGLKQCALNNIRALYAGCAIADDFEDGAVQLVVSDSQFINCTFAFDTWSPRQIFKNDLFSHCWCIVDQGNGGDVQLIHTTADLSWSFINDSTDWTSSSVELTNSILTSVTNMIDLWGYPPYSYNAPVILQNSLIAGTNNHANIIQSQNSYQIASATGIYQTVGGGSYYLTNGSPYRNAGTTNIDPTLLADIATKTTYPPIVYANQTISTNLILAPQVSRDTNTTPDLGYHYDPLDWVFAETEVDSNITFTAGTAVGWYRTTSGWYDAGDGIHLMNGATANLTGTATAPVWWVRLNTVQEHDLSGGYGPGGLTSWGSGPSSYLATIQARFLHTSAFDSDGDTFRDAGCCGGGHLLVQATDCEFYGTGVAGYYLTLDFTNCLFFRNEIGAQSDHNDAGVTLQNCTSYGGDYYDVVVQHWSGATWPVYIVDSAFENCDFHYMDTNYSYYDYNAFIQGQNRLPISGAHDVTVTNSFNWQTSWLGAFYQSTNSPLLNKGSTSATNVGLYHFTTQTNQTVEGTNIVSIGYHYVAVDQYGNPLDSNGDGIPDYLEDANGNGLVDSGEIGWNIVGDLGLKVLITQPRNGSNVP